MKFNRAKAVVISIVVVLVCAAMIVVASLAVFSDRKQSVGNHLQAGTLAAGFVKESERGEKLNLDGMLAEYSDEEEVDLAYNSDPVFVLESMVPGAWTEVTLRIENNGDIPFDYSMQLANLAFGGDSEVSKKLAGKLTVSVNGGTAVALSGYSDALTEGRLVADTDVTVTIRVDFPLNPDVLDNGGMGGSVTFDITVSAVQVTE